jgi:YhcN/YlaJ family sporulation lipoprotein
MKKNKILVIAISIAVLVGIAGCTPQDTGLNNTNNRLTTQVRDNRNVGMNNDDLLGMDNGGNLNNGMTRDTRSNTMTTNIGDLNNNANLIARRIGALPEVNKASVVLTNDNALIGVSLSGSTNVNNRVDTTENIGTTNNVGTTDANNNTTISSALRERIERIVRDTANFNVENISITADPNLYTRIQGISRNMTNTVGNDVNNFTNDIEDIIRSIVPGTRTNTNTNNTILNR